jgi:hypothetical protein
MFVMMPMVVNDGVDVGGLVADCLRELDICHKEAWMVAGYGDGAQWHRALKGQAPLDLWKLRHLPIQFWQKFLPKLASSLIQQFFVDVAEPYRMAKADVKPVEHERKSA